MTEHASHEEPGGSPAAGHDAPRPLPADDHVHSQWSWDADAGSMELTCARAVELGLPSIAFTEHFDVTTWVLPPGVTLPARWAPLVHGDRLTPPPLDVEGYAESLEHCRARYPTLRIRSGVELSEPHRHEEPVRDVLRRGSFERVLASVHSAPVGAGGGFVEYSARYLDLSPADVVREYLAETVRLVEKFDAFEVLAHIDYPVRYWPTGGPAYDVLEFEDDYRAVLDVLARSGRALEVNTRVPLAVEVLRWWHDAGGDAITFASDAHEPAALAHGFAEAAAMAEATGFRPGLDPQDFWGRD